MDDHSLFAPMWISVKAYDYLAPAVADGFLVTSIVSLVKGQVRNGLLLLAILES